MRSPGSSASAETRFTGGFATASSIGITPPLRRLLDEQRRQIGDELKTEHVFCFFAVTPKSNPRKTRPERAPGVYVVTCGKDLDVDGQRVQAGEIVYVGKATRLRSRLSQFSRQTFDRGSHWGGVRVLHIPADARRVHWAVSHEPRDAERAMLAAFVARHGRGPFANRAR